MNSGELIKWMQDAGYWQSYERNTQVDIDKRRREGYRMAFNNATGFILWYEQMFPSFRKVIRNSFDFGRTPEGRKYWEDCDARLQEELERRK